MIASSTTYYPFGMPLKSRALQAYRFGFNGMEKDPEITGELGSHYTAPFWEYDTRIGRRWNVDPVDKPWESSYAAFANNPIFMVDPNGDNADEWDVNIETGETTWKSNKGGTDTQHFNINNGKEELITSVSTPGSVATLNYNSTTIGNTFSANLSIYGTNGSDDASHNIDFFQGVTKSLNLESPLMSSVGLGLSGGSIGMKTAITLGNLDKKLDLIDEGMFLANYKGVPKTWSLGFKGNQYVSSSLVAAKKSKFLNNVKYLNGMKYFGTGFGILGTAISGVQFGMTNDPALKLEYGFDVCMGGVGFIGVPGAIASGLYFSTKPLQKLNAEYINKAQSGMSDLGKGYHAIQLAPFK